MINKIQYYLFALTVLLAVFSCSDDKKEKKPFDHVAQALKDKDTINKFLVNHYFDDDIDSIKPIKEGKLALIKDARLKKVGLTKYNIDYTYYYFIKNEEKQGKSPKGSPTIVDSVFVKYHLKSFVNSSNVINRGNKNTPIWFNSANPELIAGWASSLTHFKAGILETVNNGPIKYKDYGEGFFILPSGLAYRNATSRNITMANNNLIYYINLYDFVKDTDQDNDGIPSIKEDLNKDGDVTNDDSDGDGISNFIDIDDDGDGVLTINEDTNGDGDPTNDFSDKEKYPNTPNYLNFKVR